MPGDRQAKRSLEHSGWIEDGQMAQISESRGLRSVLQEVRHYRPEVQEKFEEGLYRSVFPMTVRLMQAIPGPSSHR